MGFCEQFETQKQSYFGDDNNLQVQPKDLLSNSKPRAQLHQG